MTEQPFKGPIKVGRVYIMRKPRKGRYSLPRLVLAVEADRVKSATCPARGVVSKYETWLSMHWFRNNVEREMLE